MRFKNKLMYSLFGSAAFILTSIFIPLIPCKQAPNVPNPIYSWSTCSLNPDKIKTIGHIVKYFGYTTSLKDSYIIAACISFFTIFTVLHLLTKKRR